MNNSTIFFLVFGFITVVFSYIAVFHYSKVENREKEVNNKK